MAIEKINEVRLINQTDITKTKNNGVPYPTDIILIRNGFNYDLLPIVIVTYKLEGGDVKEIRANDPEFLTKFSLEVSTNLKPDKLAAVGIELTKTTTSYNLRALPQTSPESVNYTRLNAFQLTVSVSLTGGDTETATIRCCVFPEMTSWWYTPSTLTIRPNDIPDLYPKYSVFAKFGGIVADITELNGVNVLVNDINVDGIIKPIVEITDLYANSFKL